MRGISRFSRETLLSHSIEKLRWGTFLHFTKFLLSENIMDKRVGGRKEYHDNLSIFFVSQYQKTSWGNLSISYKIPAIEIPYG